MIANWLRTGNAERALARRLRKQRPEPTTRLLRSIADDLGVERRPSAAPRLAFAGGLTVVLLAALGAVGGVGYAASSVQDAVKAVQHVFVPSAKRGAVVLSGLTAGGDQYKPGYGYGDKNHNHSGPPGLHRGEQGAFAPLVTGIPLAGGKAQLVKFKLSIDEQAHLWISVLNPRGKPLLLTQDKGTTKIGGRTVRGKQTKFIQYLVLIPRDLPIQLRIPSNLLVPGRTYRVRIVAKDPDGNKSSFVVPFRAGQS